MRKQARADNEKFLQEFKSREGTSWRQIIANNFPFLGILIPITCRLESCVIANRGKYLTKIVSSPSLTVNESYLLIIIIQLPGPKKPN